MSLGIGNGLTSNRRKIAETAEKLCHIILTGWFHWQPCLYTSPRTFRESEVKHSYMDILHESSLQKTPKLILKTRIRYFERSSIWKKYYENSWNGFMHQSDSQGHSGLCACEMPEEQQESATEKEVVSEALQNTCNVIDYLWHWNCEVGKDAGNGEKEWYCRE